MVDAGVPVNTPEVSWPRETPLYAAARVGDLPMVQYLVETAKADIEAGTSLVRTTIGDTPLQVALKHDYEAVYLYLLAQGAVLSETFTIGDVVRHDSLGAAEFLYARGVAVRTTDLEDAVGCDGKARCIQWLVDRGAAITDDIVFAAAERGEYEVVKCLLANGGNR